MAYAVKYRFPFESVEGVEWTIDILKDGYSGAVNIRPVGGSPQLRKDKNDNICGTSLDLTAECHTDGEFEEFSSSNPFSFQVKVYHGNTLVWQGYVSPELYSAPDIAPPYDVRVTATDGLGELKLHYFEAQGRKTLSALFSYLLGFTGLSLGYRLISDLSDEFVGPKDLLSSVYVNIDYLAGETCYDVLQALLATLHFTITQNGENWLLQKETGIAYNEVNGTVGCYVDGVSKQMGVPVFGSMDTHNLWPVGHMTREYIAPKKKMIVTADNHYRENILGTWTPDGNASNEGDYWLLPAAGDGLSQTITFQQEVSKHLVLSIKVRNIGDGEDAGNLGVYVKLDGSYYQSSSYLYLSKYTGKRRRPGNDAIWSTVSSTWDAEVQAPSNADTDQDYVTIDLVIPLYDNGPRSYVYASSLEIQVFNGDQLYPKRVYDISLYQYEQTKGFRKIVNLDNGARGEAPDVNLVFPCTTDINDYNGLEEMVYGVPVTSSNVRIDSWNACGFSDLDFMSLIARDYAISYASPRVRLSGTLQIGGGKIPPMFIDSFDNVLYLVESCSWDLRNDEISVQMISKPTTSITIDGETTEEGETENPTGHQQADYSGSGGGGSDLPIASATVLGGVKVGTGLSIDSSTGVLTATGGGGGGVQSVSVQSLSSSSAAVSKIAKITVDGTETYIYNDAAWGNENSSARTIPLTLNGTQKTLMTGLPPATISSLGGVIVGSGLSIDGDGVLFTTGGGGGGGGTVTSVAMTVPTGFSVTGSPVTTSGTLAVSLDSQAKNKVLASPTSAAGVPSFRVLDASDIPNLPASKITSGTLDAARIPNLDASKITAGTLDAARIPNLDASKITSGTFAAARIPDLSSKYVTLDTAQTITGKKTFTGGVDANYIDLGDARLKWDSTTHSLHVTKRPGSSYAGDINVMVDGDVGAGGPGSGSTIKYVNCVNQSAYDSISPKAPATIYTIGTASSPSKIYLGSVQIH